MAARLASHLAASPFVQLGFRQRSQASKSGGTSATTLRSTRRRINAIMLPSTLLN
jgi:hypothetical protein